MLAGLTYAVHDVPVAALCEADDFRRESDISSFSSQLTSDRGPGGDRLEAARVATGTDCVVVVREPRVANISSRTI